MSKIKVAILFDKTNDWIEKYIMNISNPSQTMDKYSFDIFYEPSNIKDYDLVFILGYTKILKRAFLKSNKLNLVIHESDLPKGRGWSPLSWQILKGENKIPIVLFEADEEVDSGKIFLKDVIELDGTELFPELKRKQGEKTLELIKDFLKHWPNIKAVQQEGAPSYYNRRKELDDKLNVDKSILDNFNNLRIVDNDRFPAWFEIKGCKYILKIYKDE